MNERRPLLLICAAMALSAAACERDTVTHVRVPKSADAPPAMPPMMMGGSGMPPGAMPPAGMPGGAMPAGQVAPTTDFPPLLWTLPSGWTAKMESGMRFATLKPAGAGKVEVSVVVLPGTAGGDLANVNRWRGQLGLAPIDETQLAALRKPMQTDAGPVALFDLVTEGKERSRMLAAILTTESGYTWFLKMTGGADEVAAKQAEYFRLLSSLHFGKPSAGEK